MENVLNKLEQSVLVIDSQGNIKFCNNTFLIEVEYESSELENCYIDKILKEDNILNKIKEAIEQEPISLKVWTRFDKRLRYQIEVTTGTWQDKKMIYVIGKEIKEELYSKEDLEQLLDEAPFMVAIKSVQGKYVYSNKATSRVIKSPKDEIIGKTDQEIFGKDFGSQYNSEDQAITKAKTPQVSEKYLKKPDGELQVHQCYKFPLLDENDEVKHIVKLSRDEIQSEEIEAFYQKMYTKNTIKMSAWEKLINYKSLENIETQLLHDLRADSINIWIYDKDTEQINSKYFSSTLDELPFKDKKIQLNKSIVNQMIYNNHYQGTKTIEERLEENLRRSLTEDELDRIFRNKIGWIGLYNITYKEEFLGIIVIGYKDDNMPNIKNKELIKGICNQIGLLLKNERISYEARKEFEKRIEIEEELKHFLDTAINMMAIVDEKGKFVKVNQGCHETLGWFEEEFLNIKWQDIILPEDLKFTSKVVQLSRFNNNRVKRIVNRYKSKNGDIVWLEWGFKYIKEKKVYICTARNVTERKKIEEQKKIYEQKYQEESIKNEFFSNISHEFKTPINIILATIQLINTSINCDETSITGNIDFRKYVHFIKQNSYRLLRLVNNLIDITKIDTGYYKINLENRNIVEVVEDITISVAQYVEGKGIELIFDTEVEEEIVACDPDKIERIMLNLLSNAIKHTGKQGKILVFMTMRNERIKISVKDDGIGIPDEKLHTIFERFIQVDDTLTREKEGSGIGLSLVKSLVEMHGGSISVQSEVGKGTEITFEIPIITLENSDRVGRVSHITNNCIEKCNIEFSDIYTLN